ncbi:MAG: hypothetical protein GYB65_01735 [Chloroflexi bacterium]|nr:hypothetical protein [Chloroflexota bacterium]
MTQSKHDWDTDIYVYEFAGNCTRPLTDTDIEDYADMCGNQHRYRDGIFVKNITIFD